MTNHQETTTNTRFRAEMHRSRDQAFNGTPNDVPGTEATALPGHDRTAPANETRPRTTPAPAGTHHTHGTVPRAERSH
ncbi:hypothetical protein [Nocardiopsis lucentensis]|uniref:hypothetical protein n=1 Tax=Nocardiopsis lucentensis TaxID=53441 RepID=UPI00034BF885|nr:hypothetical protein [Nocardiopsis lucentensis]